MSLYQSCQSTGVLPCDSKILFVCEKCLQPKNAPRASGDGCAASRTWCLERSIRSLLLRAKLPHKRNTTPLQLSDMHLITASVNSSQPILLWDAASPLRTVSTALSMRTPWRAHFSRFGYPLICTPRSDSISLNIFFKEGGGGQPGSTEKQSPCACPGS